MFKAFIIIKASPYCLGRISVRLDNSLEVRRRDFQ